MLKFRSLFLLILIIFSGISCDDNETALGDIEINIRHLVKGTSLQFDQMLYENEAGNPYEVSEIQWFISDLTLKTSNGKLIPVFTDSEFAHYIDTDIPESMNLRLEDVKRGRYSSVILTFGIKGSKNVPGAFPDPPESLMIWPLHMGGPNGGYHYMKLNGFWTDPDEIRQPFNFHLGVGKVGEEYFQNWFEVELETDFQVAEGKSTQLALEMDVDQWFQNPNIYDFDVYGGKIMNNQEAMGAGCENGALGVFSIQVIQSPSN